MGTEMYYYIISGANPMNWSYEFHISRDCPDASQVSRNQKRISH